MKLITHEKHQEILNRGYSLDHIAILKNIDEGLEINMDNTKVAVLHQSLVRKGLLFEKENKLTTIGKELIIFVDTKDRKRIIKPKVESSEFDLWWEAYPRTDTFTHRGKKFEGSRSFRVDKDNCRTKFNKIMLEGEYTVTQMIDAISLEIYQKMEKSFKEGSNKLAYMQNSLTYLNQRTFEGFIDLIKSGVKIESSSKPMGGTDI